MINDSGHIPTRCCVACRRRGPKGDFIKLVRGENRMVFLDTENRYHGRGVYVCRTAECLVKARKKKAFAWSLKVDEGIIPYEALFSATEQSDPDNG